MNTNSFINKAHTHSVHIINQFRIEYERISRPKLCRALYLSLFLLEGDAQWKELVRKNHEIHLAFLEFPLIMLPSPNTPVDRTIRVH